VVVPLSHVEAIKSVFVFLSIDVGLIGLLKLSCCATFLGILPLYIGSFLLAEVEVVSQFAIG